VCGLDGEAGLVWRPWRLRGCTSEWKSRRLLLAFRDEVKRFFKASGLLRYTFGALRGYDVSIGSIECKMMEVGTDERSIDFLIERLRVWPETCKP